MDFAPHVWYDSSTTKGDRDMIWKEFESAREELFDRLVTAWHNDEAFSRFDKLKRDTLALAKSIDDEPHPVIKARAFEFILENAPLTICPDDPFGIALEAQKMDSIPDIGCHYEKILNSLSCRFMSELGEKLNRPEDKEFVDSTRNYLLNEFYIDYNHSVPGWEAIFSLGIPGLLDRAESYRQSFGNSITPEQTAYFDGIRITYEAILKLFERIAEELSKLPGERAKYMKKAVLALHDGAPGNSYEALLLAWLFWYLEENIDCVRCRTMGQLDVLYKDFFDHALAAGILTTDELVDLMSYFMCEFHVFRVAYQQPMYLGGVDEDGNCLVNEYSYLWLDAYNKLSAPNPKLQAKISTNTPDRFLDKVLETIRNGNSSISIMNDEVAAESLMKLGVPAGEARTNVMAGCWDYTVRNHEVKTIPVRASLPKILEYTLTDGVCLSTGKRVLPARGVIPENFDGFIELFESRFDELFGRIRSIIENWELYLAEISPSNMFSATHTDSLSQGIDGYARGMKYNTTVYTVAGVATLIDSLCMIKKYVYDRHDLSLKDIVNIMDTNWEGHEDLRHEILSDPDKYGSGSELADGLTVRLCKYFASTVNGKPNSRGTAMGRGFWKIGTLSIDKNVRYGKLMKATPDGRLAGEPLSKNMSSVIGMDRGGITTFLRSVAKIDFTDFPHSGMVDVVLHPSTVSGERGLIVLRGLVRAYFRLGGHSIQFNIFDSKTLRAAQADPDRYKNLQIRVCGWNVYFVELEKVLQDSFIREAEKTEKYGM